MNFKKSSCLLGISVLGLAAMAQPTFAQAYSAKDENFMKTIFQDARYEANLLRAGASTKNHAIGSIINHPTYVPHFKLMEDLRNLASKAHLPFPMNLKPAQDAAIASVNKAKGSAAGDKAFVSDEIALLKEEFAMLQSASTKSDNATVKQMAAKYAPQFAKLVPLWANLQKKL